MPLSLAGQILMSKLYALSSVLQEIVDAIQASEDGSTAPPDAEVRSSQGVTGMETEPVAACVSRACTAALPHARSLGPMHLTS